MSLLRKALMALSVCAMGSVTYAQDMGDSNYATGMRTLLPAGFFMHDQSAQAGCATCNTGCASDCNYKKVGVFGDYLYMRLRNGDVPYALPVDGLGPQALPTGDVATVNPIYDSGFRAGVWFAPMELFAVRATFLSWDSSATSTVDVADGSILRALTTHPSTDNTALDSLSATAELRNDLRIIDVDGVVRLVDCGPWTVNGVAGARYARLRQFFQANYLILGDTQVNTSSEFEGIGPRFGLETEVWIKGGLGFYGKGSLSLLLGDFNTTYTQANVFQEQLVSTGFKQSRLVPNVELELGVTWTSCNDRLRLSAGYMISSWSNVVSTNDLIDAVQNGTFHQNKGNLRDTLVFDSLVGHIEVRF